MRRGLPKPRLLVCLVLETIDQTKHGLSRGFEQKWCWVAGENQLRQYHHAGLTFRRSRSSFRVNFASGKIRSAGPLAASGNRQTA